MNHATRHISTNEFIILRDKPELKKVDVRPVDAYNGWCLQNEPRGGHIKGAKSLSAKWIKYIDWIEIVRSKNILPHHEIVIYGYSSEESEILTNLIKSGISPEKHNAFYCGTGWRGSEAFFNAWLMDFTIG